MNTTQWEACVIVGLCMWFSFPATSRKKNNYARVCLMLTALRRYLNSSRISQLIDSRAATTVHRCNATINRCPDVAIFPVTRWRQTNAGQWRQRHSNDAARANSQMKYRIRYLCTSVTFNLVSNGINSLTGSTDRTIEWLHRIKRLTWARRTCPPRVDTEHRLYPRRHGVHPEDEEFHWVAPEWRLLRPVSGPRGRGTRLYCFSSTASHTRKQTTKFTVSHFLKFFFWRREILGRLYRTTLNYVYDRHTSKVS